MILAGNQFGCLFLLDAESGVIQFFTPSYI